MFSQTALLSVEPPCSEPFFVPSSEIAVSVSRHSGKKSFEKFSSVGATKRKQETGGF
jgi:hypothetical protein